MRAVQEVRESLSAAGNNPGTTRYTDPGIITVFLRSGRFAMALFSHRRSTEPLHCVSSASSTWKHGEAAEVTAKLHDQQLLLVVTSLVITYTTDC